MINKEQAEKIAGDVAQYTDIAPSVLISEMAP